MSEKLQLALDVIAKAQPRDEGPVWMCGEQLKDILRASPELAQIVIEDFEADKDQLKACEAKIHKYATAHKGCCTPKAADQIIREHFGLGEQCAPAAVPVASGAVAIDLDSFF